MTRPLPEYRGPHPAQPCLTCGKMTTGFRVGTRKDRGSIRNYCSRECLDIRGAAIRREIAEEEEVPYLP